MKRIVLLLLSVFVLTAAFADSQYVVTANSLNVRKYANSNAEVLFKVKKGDEVTVKEISGSWAFIDVPKGGGWVAKKYLAKPGAANSKSNAKEKPLKKYRTTQKVLDEPIHKAMTWIIRVAAGWGGLFFIVLMIPAFKRKKALAHFFGLGLMLFVLLYALAAVTTLSRFICPAAIIVVFLWPLLYTRMKYGILSLIALGLLVGGLVALYFMFRVEFEGTFWVWLWTIVAGFVNLGLIGATISTQGLSKCPYCSYYADHPVIDTQYIDSSVSSETSTRDTYSHSETRGNVTTNYYTRHHDVKFFQHDFYRDTLRCPHCGNTFTRERTTKRQVGSTTY